MKTLIASIAGAYALVLVAVGCSGATPASVTSTTAQQADVAAYAAEEQACVQAAIAADAGLASANACIAGVKSRWCGDGGQLAGYCAGQDGGSK